MKTGSKSIFLDSRRSSDTTWVTEQAYVLPARVYSAEMGGGKYSMTVVDYSVIERPRDGAVGEVPDRRGDVPGPAGRRPADRDWPRLRHAGNPRRPRLRVIQIHSA